MATISHTIVTSKKLSDPFLLPCALCVTGIWILFLPMYQMIYCHAVKYPRTMNVTLSDGNGIYFLTITFPELLNSSS